MDFIKQVEQNQGLIKALTPRWNKYIPIQPTPKQQAALCLDQVQDVFYGGATRGGKTIWMLAAALQYVDMPTYNAILIRDTFKNLDMPGSLLNVAHEWLAGTDARWRDGKQYIFPSGSTLNFGYLDGPRDHVQYQGANFQFVGIDEIVNIRKYQAMYLFTRLTRTVEQKKLGIPLRFRAASNPPDHSQVARGEWVKKRYVDMKTRKPGAIFIPAKLEDNPHEDAQAYNKSMSAENVDPITRAQLLDGDWNIRASGRMFKREWFQVVEVPPLRHIKFLRYWDLAATEKKATDPKAKDPDYTSGTKIGMTPDGLFFIVSIIRGQWSPRQVELILKQTAISDGPNCPIHIEQEGGSSGPLLIDYYRRNLLRGYRVKGHAKRKSKIVSWELMANKAEAGDVFLVAGPWNAAFLDEIELVPDGAHDDQADSTSGGLNLLAGIGGSVTPRVSHVSHEQGAQEFKDKPDIQPGEQLIAVYEGGVQVGWEKLGRRRTRRGLSG